jgi:uncharacterized protein (TIGR02466 family)
MPLAPRTWLEASQIHTMFPTCVWQFQVAPDVHEPANVRLLELIARLRGGATDLAPGAAWQSTHALHELPELGELVTCFGDAVGSVLRFLQSGHEHLAITGCWANVYPPGAAHRMHTHPNNFLSGVYYVRTAAGADTINFHDPRPQTAIIRPPVTALTSVNTDQVVVRVADGALLLFPAFLPHSVDANRSTQDRVSLSFNVMFSGFTEQLAKPLWGKESY